MGRSYQQVPEDALDAYALACECRQTFSGNKSMLNRLYLNFTADVDNALLFLHSKDTSSQDTDEIFILMFLFINVIWLRPRSKSAGVRAGNFSVHLHLTRRTRV